MNSPSPTTNACPSAYALDLLVAGEHAAKAAAAVQAHCDACATCASRLVALRQAQTSFAQAHRLPARAPRRLPARPWWKTWQGLLAPAAGMVAVAALALLVWQPPPPTRELVATTRTKGGFALAYFLQRDGIVTRGQDGDVVYPQDALRFSFVAPTPGFTYLLGLDATGKAAVYYEPPANATAVAMAQPVLMPDSIVLDDTLGGELFWGLHCDAAQDPAALTATLAQTRSLANVPACASVTLTLEKRRRD
ncbi:MAG: hypothetical protein IPL79_14630 [Myxococcales bacterium]|nr:hypothetical protein [Myxococcales bacterium]